MRHKLYLETFGCQMNVLDSELVLGQLRAHGYESVEDRDDADVILYNTCSVREHAEQKVWSRLGELRDRKARRSGTHHRRDRMHGRARRRRPFSSGIRTSIFCAAPANSTGLTSLVHNAAVTQPPMAANGSGRWR